MRVFVDTNVWYPIRVDKFLGEIIATAPDGRIHPVEHRHLISEMVGKDPDDHIFATIARAGFVDVLLTLNLVDFPQRDVGSYCRVLSPDLLFSELAEKYPIEFARLLREMSENLRNPPMSVNQVLEYLSKCGLREFVKIVIS